MLHHVKIAMGGTRVSKYRWFFFWRGGGLTPVGATRVSKYIFWRDIQSHIRTYSTCVRATSWWSKSLSTVYSIYVESMLYLGWEDYSTYTDNVIFC